MGGPERVNDLYIRKLKSLQSALSECHGHVCHRASSEASTPPNRRKLAHREIINLTLSIVLAGEAALLTATALPGGFSIIVSQSSTVLKLDTNSVTVTALSDDDIHWV